MFYPDYLVAKLRGYIYSGRTNAPFLSGDSFAALADYYAYGPSGSGYVDVDALGRARVIFVNSDRLVKLVEEYGATFSAHVLITGNSDVNWDEIPALPESVVLWLAQNSSIDDPLVRTLPIGIENLRLGGRGLPRYYKPDRGRRVEGQVFVPPMSNTNPIRSVTVGEALKRPELFDVATGYMRSSSYLKLAKSSRFVLCLEGNGYENHRVWETLYFGNFPVLLSTPWSRSLAYLGLPMLLVDSLSYIDEVLLNDFSLQHKDVSPETTEQLWLPYWKSVVDSYRAEHPPAS